jgi:hypothetical protein
MPRGRSGSDLPAKRLNELGFRVRRQSFVMVWSGHVAYLSTLRGWSPQASMIAQRKALNSEAVHVWCRGGIQVLDNCGSADTSGKVYYSCGAALPLNDLRY